MQKPKKLLTLLLLVSILMSFGSCRIYYRLHKTKAEKAQLKANRKKEEEWEKKEKIQKENRKRVMAMQTKNTRKRMKSNKKKSDRINAGKSPTQQRHFKLPRIFNPSKWWRK